MKFCLWIEAFFKISFHQLICIELPEDPIADKETENHEEKKEEKKEEEEEEKEAKPDEKDKEDLTFKIDNPDVCMDPPASNAENNVPESTVVNPDNYKRKLRCRKGIKPYVDPMNLESKYNKDKYTIPTKIDEMLKYVGTFGKKVDTSKEDAEIARLKRLRAEMQANALPNKIRPSSDKVQEQLLCDQIEKVKTIRRIAQLKDDGLHLGEEEEKPKVPTHYK